MREQVVQQAPYLVSFWQVGCSFCSEQFYADTADAALTEIYDHKWDRHTDDAPVYSFKNMEENGP